MITLITCLIGGLGAGIGTGLAGLSAAAVISPMLITFLGMPAYQAVGIALASDVLASAVSAYTYGKNKNLDIKNGMIMMITVLIFTMVGSYISSLVPNKMMGNFSVYMTFLVGLKFIIKPVMTTKDDMEEKSVNTNKEEKELLKRVISILFGEKIGEEKTKELIEKIDGGEGKMLALVDMIRNENKMYIIWVERKAEKRQEKKEKLN